MTAVLTSIAPILLALAAAGSILLTALRRRQPKPVPAYVRRPDEPSRPQPAPRPTRGCNW